jgi:predicted O-methyltransferase YrrM
MYYRYQYFFNPEQLAFLTQCITETRDVSGDIVEIGCALGHTTCFLNRHMQCSGIQKPYYCIDTFSGFAANDVAFETNHRGKAPAVEAYRNTFSYNNLKWFKYTLKLNGCDNVTCIQTDVKNYKFDRPISFCLLDVDLYQPSRYALESIWPLLSPGGIIVVDDCDPPPHQWDGAYEAYTEFTKERSIAPRFVAHKLGVLKKDAAAARA